MTHNTKGLSQLVHDALENYMKTVEDPRQVSNLLATVNHEVERTLVEFALKVSDYNKVHTAQLLGINRNTLYKRLNFYNIKP